MPLRFFSTGAGALIAMAMVSLHPGNPKIAAAVCSSVHQEGIPQCGPAIEYLRYSAEEAHQDIEAERHRHNFPLIYATTAPLALLPLVVLLGAGIKRRVKGALTLSCVALGTVLVSVPLYIYAQDWGRWIYMNILCLTLLIFHFEIDRVETPKVSKWSSAALVIYAVAWTLPHSPRDAHYFGYVGNLVSSIRHHR
jgi:hypothetical protein